MSAYRKGMKKTSKITKPKRPKGCSKCGKK